jgi:hypothetical protein
MVRGQRLQSLRGLRSLLNAQRSRLVRSSRFGNMNTADRADSSASVIVAMPRSRATLGETIQGSAARTTRYRGSSLTVKEFCRR